LNLIYYDNRGIGSVQVTDGTYRNAALLNFPLNLRTYKNVVVTHF